LPVKISDLLTDDGSQFTDQFHQKQEAERQTQVRRCLCLGSMEHRLALRRHPQTKGMVERFNGRINKLL
jgi:transposase InsO family protein